MNKHTLTLGCTITHISAHVRALIQLHVFFMCPDFLEEEEVVDTEDEAEIVGTQLPKKPSHPSQSSHTSNTSHQNSKSGTTPAGKDEEEEEDPDEEEEGAVDSIIHRRERRPFPHRDRQIGRDLAKDWGRDHIKANMRQDSRKGLKEPQRGVLPPDMNSMVRGRSLSWIRSGPAELDLVRKKGGVGGGGEEGGGEKGPETLPKLKSSLLFPQKSSLSALAGQAKQILSNSAHNNNLQRNKNKRSENKKEKREENKIYITRPRPAKERERDREREQRRERREERASRYPREVFPGVFLYQTGKTTRLVNMGAKGHAGGVIRGGKILVSAHPLWSNPTTKEGKIFPHNGSINIEHDSTQKSANRAAGPKQPEISKRKGERLKSTHVDLPSKGKPLTLLSHHQDPPRPPVTLPRLNSTENTLQGQSRVTSYLRTSEITESQQQPDPDPNPAELDQDTNHSNLDADPDPEPEPEEGEMSDYSYEEVEARPGWSEESINWQRTFSVNPMDFELLRSDWNDLRCNVSGNLQLAESEVVDVLAQYMEKLNERNGG